MRKIFIFIMLLLTSCVAQGQVILRNLTEEALVRLFTTTAEREVPVILSTEQRAILAMSYPGNQQLLKQNKSLTYYNGKIYGDNVKLLRQDFDSKLLQQHKAEYDAILRSLNSNSEIRSSVTFSDNTVLKIQETLVLLGYDIAPDNKWGNNTKLAVDKVLGFNCAFIDRHSLLYILFQKEIQFRKQQQVCYKLTILGKDGIINELELKKDELNKKMEEFPCGVEEICLKIRDKIGGSMEFACKDSLGNNITIKLSTEKSSLDLNFKSPDGGSSKLSIDTKGKLKLTNSDGEYSNSVEHTINSKP